MKWCSNYIWANNMFKLILFDFLIYFLLEDLMLHV